MTLGQEARYEAQYDYNFVHPLNAILGHSLYDLGQEAGSEAQYDHILSFVQEQKSALCLHIAHIDSWD